MDTIAQVVTIVAVLLGALTTYVTNHLMERSRHRAALRVRWDEKKLDAYADYVGQVRGRSMLLSSSMRYVRIFDLCRGVSTT